MARHQQQNLDIACPLPRLELAAYVIVFCSSVLYMSVAVLTSSQEHTEVLEVSYLTSGWQILGRQQDTSDSEWAFWSKWSFELWPYLLVHLIFGQLLRSKPNARRCFFLAFSFMTVYSVVGHWPLLFVLAHCLLAYFASSTRSIVFVWLISIGLLSTLNFEAPLSILRSTLPERDFDSYQRNFYFVLFITAMANLRYTSFALEQCSTDTRAKYSFLDMMVYVFYLPLFFTGPLLTFQEFHSQFSKSLHAWTMGRLLTILRDLVRVLAWAICAEFLLHYLYFHAMQHDEGLLNRLPLWAMAGTGFWHGQFFMVKYVVMFGLPSCLARLDQLIPPPQPKCISRIYLYSEMWKNFDNGLYNFLKRHIYVPLGGSRSGLLRQFLGSFCCFAFVYFWHGAEKYLLVWCLLNFLGISIEALGQRVVMLPSIRCKVNNLSGQCQRRLHAALAVPLFIMSVLAIFTFFGGTTAGYMYYRRIIVEGWPVSTITLSVVVYCLVQTSMEVKKWELKTKHSHTS